MSDKNNKKNNNDKKYDEIECRVIEETTTKYVPSVRSISQSFKKSSDGIWYVNCKYPDVFTKEELMWYSKQLSRLE